MLHDLKADMTEEDKVTPTSVMALLSLGGRGSVPPHSHLCDGPAVPGRPGVLSRWLAPVEVAHEL